MVKLRYKGAEEMKPDRIFVGKHLLKESLGFSADDIYALIHVPGSYTNCAEAWHNISKVWEQEVDFEDNEALYDRALKVADRICLDPPADGVGLVQPRDGACLDPPGDGACHGPPVDAVAQKHLQKKQLL
ncbi:hypothetical protein FKM82_027950 [Ascaphus truei]